MDLPIHSKIDLPLMVRGLVRKMDDLLMMFYATVSEK